VDRRALAINVTYDKKDKGDVIFMKGEQGTKFYVVLYGATEVL
jgi:CRP-like cAMP-binding protein